jgi:glycosyltransferase involved in cell wall biosynthesis
MQVTPPERMLVIVPAWNEEATLPSVVAEIHETVPGADVLVVNDGSTDRTATVARTTGASVLDLPINLGVGGAMRAGYKYAHRSGYDLAVQLDADGQHDPREITELVRRMRETSADLVIGARFAGRGSYQVRGPRKWSMKLLAAVLSRVT